MFRRCWYLFTCQQLTSIPCALPIAIFWLNRNRQRQQSESSYSLPVCRNPIYLVYRPKYFPEKLSLAAQTYKCPYWVNRSWYVGILINITPLIVPTLFRYLLGWEYLVNSSWYHPGQKPEFDKGGLLSYLKKFTEIPSRRGKCFLN